MNKTIIAILAIASISAANVASASVLDRIKTTGVISVGYIDNSAPFSYLDGDKPIGYSIDISNKVIEAVKAETGLPNLRVERVLITPENRLAMIQSGAVNFECGKTPHTPENDALVGFSASIYFEFVGPNMRRSYGCTYPIKDREFQKIVNRAIVTDQVSGEAGKLYSKWFKQPVPGTMVGLFIIPSDRAY